MTYTVVYYELTRIERQVEADSVEHAVAAAEKIRWDYENSECPPDSVWEGCDETTYGTNGVEEVLDSEGNLVYNAGTIAGYPKIEGEEMPA